MLNFNNNGGNNQLHSNARQTTAATQHPGYLTSKETGTSSLCMLHNVYLVQSGDLLRSPMKKIPRKPHNLLVNVNVILKCTEKYSEYFRTIW